MRTTQRNWQLFAAIFLGIAAPATSGCSTDWLRSPSADYAKPGELSQDVSDLPDPSAPAPSREKERPFANPIAAQYGGATMKESPERLLLQANAYFDENRFHDSARLYKKYLATPEARTAPAETLAVAHYRIGLVARKKMNFNEAKAEFQQALQFAPKNAEYRFALGKSCYDSTDFAGADAAFSTLISENPNYPEAQYYYGLTLLEGTRRAEAIRPLTVAVGELQASALLTDKYYQIGDVALATQAETQTAQIAARLGQASPKFPHKTAQNVQQKALAINETSPSSVATPNPAPIPTPVSTAPSPQVAQTAQTQQSRPIAQTSQIQQTPSVAQATQIRQTIPTAPTQETSGSVFASRLTPRLADAANDANATPSVSTTPTELATNPGLPPSQLLLPALKETLARSKKKTVETEIPTDAITATPVETANVEPVETDALSEISSFGTTAFDAVNRTADEIFAESAVETAVADAAENSTLDETLDFKSTSKTEPLDAETQFDAEPSLNQDFVVPEIETDEETSDAASVDENADELAAEPIATSNGVQEIEELLAAKTSVENAVAESPTAPVETTVATNETETTSETTQSVATPPAPIQLGRRNPGLFAASDATPNPSGIAFKPGSIGSVDAAETTSNETTQIAQIAPIADILPTPQTAQNAPISEPARFFAVDARAALACVDSFETAEELVASFRAAAQTDPNANFNENDEFAFASSGSTAPLANVGAVAPTDTRSTAQLATQAPNRPTAPKSATFAAYRNKSTPEERLEAARAAGAEVRELTPNQYRRAVAAGLGKDTIKK